MIACPSCKSRNVELIDTVIYKCNLCGKIFTTVKDFK